MSGWKIAGLVVLMLVVLVFALAMSMKASFNRNFEAEIAALKARGEPLTMEELAGPKIPDGENAAVIYEQVFNEMESQAFLTDKSVIDSFPFKAGQASAQWGEAKKMLARNKHILDLLEEAASRSKYQYTIQWNGAATSFSRLAKFRRTARFLRLSAEVNARDGKMDEAVRSVDLAFKMNDSLNEEPSLIGQLVQTACFAIADRSMRDALRCGDIDEAQAKRLFDTLSKMDPNHGWKRACQGERIIFLDEMSKFKCGSSFYNKGDVTEYLRYVNKQIEMLSLSYTDAKSRGLLKNDPGFPFYAGLTKAIAPIYGRSRERRFVNICQIEGGRVFLALLAHKDRFGVYPQNIGELKSKLGWKLPRDPYSDEDFKYKPLKKGFILYSVGPDMKDDGGVQNEKRFFEPSETGDFIWEMER